jgi:hypothetical protein
MEITNWSPETPLHPVISGVVETLSTFPGGVLKNRYRKSVQFTRWVKGGQVEGQWHLVGVTKASVSIKYWEEGDLILVSHRDGRGDPVLTHKVPSGCPEQVIGVLLGIMGDQAPVL